MFQKKVKIFFTVVLLKKRQRYLMKRKLISLFIMLALVFAVAACGKNSEDSAIIDAVKENLAATEAEDVDRVMASMHPKSPAYNNTKNMLNMIFKMFDVKYELASLKVVKVEGDTATVAFEQITRKVSGDAAFKDNRVIGQHTLKKSGGKWLIYSTKIDKVEYLK